MKVNYYEVLGVDRSATEAAIRERFRQLAREHHPDRYRGPDKAAAEHKFQTLTEAVNVLTNENRRKQHDAELSSGSSKGMADPVQISKVYLAKGVKAYKEGDLKTAAENFDMASKHNPQDAKAFHYLAMATSRLPGQMRQAVAAIEAAVQKEPVNPVYLKDAGLICRKAGLRSKAERYFEEALQWDASNPEIQAALADLRHNRSEPKEASKGFSIFKKS